jgi:hypothetical protein
MSPAHVPSRRAVLRGLAGLGLGGAPLLSDAAEARDGRERKRKRKPRQTCPRGKLIGAVNVPGTGAAVRTPVLRQRQRYRLRASGYWRSNASRGQDAFADFSFGTPSSYVTEFEGVRLGLAVDGDGPDLWGSYDSGHEYERVVTGRGIAVTLRCNDAVYADNSGAVFVEIFCD